MVAKEVNAIFEGVAKVCEEKRKKPKLIFLPQNELRKKINELKKRLRELCKPPPLSDYDRYNQVIYGGAKSEESRERGCIARTTVFAISRPTSC